LSCQARREETTVFFLPFKDKAKIDYWLHPGCMQRIECGKRFDVGRLVVVGRARIKSLFGIDRLGSANRPPSRYDLASPAFTDRELGGF
jgi:hypothetical protein